MSKKLVVLSIFVVLQSVCAFAEIVRWEASSGLLPSDPAIPAEQQFILIGDASFLSFQDGALNFNDNSNTSQVNFRKYDPIPASDSDWAFQITIRINSTGRPIWTSYDNGSCAWEGWGFGPMTGVTIGAKSIWLEFGMDHVDFFPVFPSDSFSMDSTDDFHTYRVTKSSDMVYLYVDTFDIPVMFVPYSEFWCEDDQTGGGFVDLAMSGYSVYFNYLNFDILSFAYNTDGTDITISPLEQIEAIIEFIEKSAADGTLEGTGPGNSADKRLDALENMIGNAGSFIDASLIAGACEQLTDALAKTDGQSNPPDFVIGPAAEELAVKIQGVIDSLGCE